MRREAKARRAAAHARAGTAAAPALRDRFLEAVPLAAGAVVAGYAPIRDEIDVLPLLARLAERGHPCCLPVVTAPASPLRFRRWTPDAAMEEGAFGVAAPAQGEEVRPSLLLVPMLAFDRAGRRMGYGAGFYDRTLAALRAEGPVTAVGIAYADQEAPSVPVDIHDQALDWIVTEREAFRPVP
ncbi:MAG TPA: 5-formyltetrahydrofolate cyclo-ligase [Alphaproteobacteria bacterium]|nr:5-formyltetrahydrofolate cyclo-ligase [Alphaproteobacteria bacterium]